jgi:hypothetical protein
MANLLGDLTTAGQSLQRSITATVGGLGSLGGDLANLLDFGGAGDRAGYMQTPKLATTIYGLDHPALNHQIPFLKFEFFANITPNGAASQYFTSVFGDAPWSGAYPLIKSVSIPSVDVETKVLNEYNRPRVSQTKLNYKPVKLVIHDAVDGITLNMWKAYYEYYFHNGDKKPDKIKSQSLNPTKFTSGQFGYNLAQVGNLKYLFDKIDIFQVHAKKVIQTTIYNPRISNFSHDTLSYDSSETVEISLEFEYEWIEYHTCANIDDDLALQTFLSKSRPLDMNFGWQTPLSKPCNPPAVATASEGLSSMVPGGEGGLLDGIVGGFKTAAGMAQSAIGVVKDVKKTAQVIVGKAASAASVWNQVQMDVLGVDTPIIPAPSVRDISAVVNSVPTGYSDLRRFSRNVIKVRR